MRPILPTLTAMFVLVAAGKGLGAVPGLDGLSERLGAKPVAQGDASYPADTPVAGETPDGINIIDDREPVSRPVIDEETALRAQRYDLRQESERLSAEWANLELEKRKLDDRHRAEFQRLATMYARMTPSKAAAVLSSLKSSEAALFIGLMPEDAGGAILSVMSPADAVAITRELLKFSENKPDAT